MNSQLAIPISDPSQIGEARRQMQRLAVAADLDEAVAGKAAIIATELATNIARHSSGGELHLRGVNGDHPGWVEAQE
jgi:anti-sigma regulatory factor (Ser/Thr protein kinase)